MLRTTGWRRFIRSVWKDFDTKFGGILKNLDSHKNFVEKCAEIAQYQRYRLDDAERKATSTARFRTYEKDIADQNSQLDELVDEGRRKRRRAVKEWLAVGDQPYIDHARFCDVRAEYSTTARWIVQHKDINYWMHADVPSTPVLWMHGIPGAGT
jgi:hypothetical protein